MSSITYPNGQVLTSTALTQPQVQQLLATLTCGVLGITPPDYSRVRMDWPQIGQPFQNQPQNMQQPSQGQPQNVSYVGVDLWNTPYRLVRDLEYSTVSGQAQSTWAYTRGWRISWVFYGPLSSDNARAVWSATFMEYFSSQLASSNLYVVNDADEPTYSPENINGQWFPRADFIINLYETVVENILDGAVTSVEIKTYEGTGDAPVSDIVVTKP